MLRYLSIRDFVIVTSLELEFESGFTVFSGETGAGKSILLDALALTLGARADATAVRAGQARAEITAEFVVHADAQRWLTEQALQSLNNTNVNDANDGLILRRVIDANGRSRAFINGTLATLTQLREIGAKLIDIQGQRAHQQLLHPDLQRVLLDTYADLTPLVEQVNGAWRAWRTAASAVQTAQRHESERQLKREQLEWRFSELDKLAPQPGEWEDINAEHRRLSAATNLIEGAQSALAALVEDDHALLPQLGVVSAKLRKLAEIDDGLTQTLAALDPAEIHLQEAIYSLNHYVQQLSLDPDRLEQVDARLNAFYSTARKFRLQPQALAAEHVVCNQQLTALDAEADLQALRATEADAKKTYQMLAQRLSNARAQAAAVLSDKVTAQMQTLSMVGGRFEVALIALAEGSGSAYGQEQIEFRVAGHPGVPVRALAKVASGGELARISLALSVVANAASPISTLIFDEVDSGIGGAVAEVVGQLLRQLGAHRQVLCVTHLPQVAACGDQHFHVIKAVNRGGQTTSAATLLNKAGRIKEIARMLGGTRITEVTLQHAKEMLAA